MSILKNTVRVAAVTMVTAGLALSTAGTASAEEWYQESHYRGNKPSLLADHLQGTFFPKSDRLYIASGQNYPDAIAGGPLFGKDVAPLFLTDNEAGSVGGHARLRYMEVKHVPILGGHAAVNKYVEYDIKEAKPSTTTERIAGTDRYDTAALAAKKAYPTSDTVILASGQNFPDALAAGPAAAVAKLPVLLSDPKFLPARTLDALRDHGAKNVIIIGGASAVSDDVARKLQAEGLSTRRVAGQDRFLTAIEVAKEFFPTAERAALASGESFQAALTVSAVAAKIQGPLLLKRANCTPNSVQAYLNTSRIESLRTATILPGGATPTGARTNC
jgi:putative cell wall-binding protein